MAPQSETVPPEATVQQAAEQMRRLHQGLLAVTTSQGPIGMITARDIMFRAVSEGRDPTSTRVEEVMSLGLVFCYEDERLEQAIARMRTQCVGDLVVLNRSLRPVGVLGITDVAARTEPLAAGLLRQLAEDVGDS